MGDVRYFPSSRARSSGVASGSPSLETRIQYAFGRYMGATNNTDRRLAFAEMASLIAMRDAEEVHRIERERGLR